MIGMRRAVVGVYAAALVVLSAIVVTLPDESSAYSSHAPIYIDGDGDFTLENGVTGGSGTQSDPYVIEGWDIEAGSEDGITVMNTDKHFLIRDVYVHDATGFLNITFFLFRVANGTVADSTFENSKYSGLSIAESRSITLESNTISECSTAVWICYSEDVTVSMNTVSQCRYGTCSFYSENSTVHANKVQNCTEAAIKMESSSNSSVARNTIANSTCGIDVLESFNCTVTGNTLANNDCGIQATTSQYANVSGNNISADSSNGEGIVAEGCGNATICLNNVSLCNVGIRLSESEWTQVMGNHVTQTGYGISIDTSSHVVVSENVADHNSNVGIRLHSSSLCDVVDNDISGGIYGMSTWFSGLPGSWHSSHCNITGNHVTGTSLSGIYEIGMSLYSNSNNISMNEICANEGTGIYVAGNDDTLYGNLISDNGGLGVMLAAQRVTLVDNTFVNDGLYIGYQGYGMMPIEYFNTHTISDDNTVNGKPLLYFKSLTDVCVSGDSAGELIVVDSLAVDISGLDMSNTDVGVQMAYCEEVRIDNCTVTRSDRPIEVAASEFCTLSSNSVMYCQYGASVRFCNDTALFNNTLVSNTISGMSLEECARSTISSNRFSANEDYALGIWSSNQTVVTLNVLNGNGVGVSLYDSENATVFHNDFVNNTVQCIETACVNCHWNSTYPDGGNYWSDYVGEDEFSGPDQDIPGADGVGDTPYLVDDSHMDYYPLMSQAFSNLPPTAVIVVIPTTGSVGSSFSFDASGSFDADDPTCFLEVRWDWDGDGTWDTEWSIDYYPTHSYTSFGTYSVRLEVRDSVGATNITTTVVQVEEVAIPEFSSPVLIIVVLAMMLTVFAILRRGVERRP